MYYLQTSGNSIECVADLVITQSGNLVLASLTDVAIRNRKVVADIIAHNTIHLASYDTDKSTPIYSYGSKFTFKSTKQDKFSHTVIHTKDDNTAINWEGKDDDTFLAKYIQHNLSIPITAEIVSQIDRGKQSSIKELDITTTNPLFENLKGWIISPKSLLHEISKLNLDFADSDFDWSTIKNTADYLTTFIDPISKRLEGSISTLYDPDRVDQSIFEGKHTPYKGQIRPIQACIEILKNNNYAYLNGQPGVGKSLNSLKINHATQSGNYTTLIVCPTTTLNHWKQEIADCIADDVDVHIIRKTNDFIKIYNNGFEFDRPTYFLIGKETLKLDAAKRPAVNFKERTLNVEKTDSYGCTGTTLEKINCAFCPDCANPLKNENRNDTVYLDRDSFKNKPNKSNYKCGKCGTVLWESFVKKTNKTSLIKYLKTKRIKFDSLILDEAHEGSSDSILGIACRNVCKHANKIIFLSGTTNAGYSSNLHNIVMAVESHKLVEDNCVDMASWIKKYGTMVAKVDEDDKSYKMSGRVDMRESKFREVEGINPIAVVRYLMSNYVSANLSDLSDLPDFSEEFVNLDASKQVVNGTRLLDEDFKRGNRFKWKSYQNTITRRYVSNPIGWNPIPVGDSIVVPNNISEISPKERWIIQKAKSEVSEGRKVAVYTEFTGDGSEYQDGNLARRYTKALKDAGLRVYWLRASTKSAIDRRDHLAKIQDDYDVFVMSPFLVRVGVNLQFISTYIFNELGYRANIYEQAKMRGFRANSTEDNRIFYLYYGNTFEKEVCERFKLKLVESKAVESKLAIAVTGKRTASSLSKTIHDSLLEVK